MQFSKILKELEAEFPKFRLVAKEQSKFMELLFKFTLMRLWCPRFLTSFTTTIGHTIYMPTYLVGTNSGATVLRHERVHLRDSRGFFKSIWYVLTYLLLPLPVVVTGRAYWELRAYRETLKCHLEECYTFYDSELDWYVDQFTSSSYFWMFPFPTIVRKIFKNYAKEVLDARSK